MESLRALIAFSLLGFALCVTWEDTGRGMVYTLPLEQDTTIEFQNDRTFHMNQYLMAGLFPQHPKKRVLLQFEDLPSECRRIEWARMYVYFVDSHKDPMNTIQQAPEIPRPIELYQVHQPWDQFYATTRTRMREMPWARPFIDLTGSDAGPQVVDRQTILPNRPPGFVEFDVTCALTHRLGHGENHGYVMRAANEDEMGHETRWCSDRYPDQTKHAYISVLCDNPRSTQTEAQLRARCQGSPPPSQDADVRNRAATPRQGTPNNGEAPSVDTYSRGRAELPLHGDFPDTTAEACADLLDYCPATYPSSRRLLPHPTNAARYCSCRYCDSLGVTMRDMPCPQGTTFNFHMQECAYPDDCGCA